MILLAASEAMLLLMEEILDEMDDCADDPAVDATDFSELISFVALL